MFAPTISFLYKANYPLLHSNPIFQEVNLQNKNKINLSASTTAKVIRTFELSYPFKEQLVVPP